MKKEVVSEYALNNSIETIKDFIRDSQESMRNNPNVTEDNKMALLGMLNDIYTLVDIVDKASEKVNKAQIKASRQQSVQNTDKVLN